MQNRKPFTMEDWDVLRRARRVFLRPGTLEQDSKFASTLANRMHAGFQWGGLVGLIGVLVLILVHWGMLGRPTAWWYPAAGSTEIFVLWDKAAVVLACVAAIALGRMGCRLNSGRLAGALLAVAVAVVSLVHDAYRGVLSAEYLLLVYLLIVAIVPYRPWQALLLGVAMMGTLYGIGQYGVPGTPAARPDLVGRGHLVRMAFATVVLTGVAALLYATRYQQHRARREAEALHEHVARLERSKSRFFADVSHEFRTPLTLLLGTVREALGGRLGSLSSALRTRLEGMEEQARRMKRLVNQLLDLSKLDEGRLPLALSEQDLVALTRRVAAPFRSWASAEGLSFQLDVEPDRLDVWIDADRMEHVLSNLLSNAIKYTPEGGRVRLRVRRTDTHAVLSVRDTGPGVPDEIRERIFEQDQRSVPVSTDPTKGASEAPGSEPWTGMGIGLAHARSLVRRHQGEMTVDSEAGFGTEFTVRLPLGDEHVAAEDVAADPASGERDVDVTAWKEPRRSFETAAGDDEEPPDDEVPEVLVVDDEAAMREYLRDLLGTDYRVSTARNGAEALDVLQERAPDLVLSDVVMPETDGVELCRAIRDDEQLRHLPVLLLTARPEREARLSGLEAGADAYVSKPFDPVELEARIENLIEIRRIVQGRVPVPDWMEPKETSVPSEEADFLQAVNEAVDEHIDNSNFGVDWLADEMDLSPRHLRRRLKEVTRLSPAGLIRTRRLQHAATLLEEGADTISEVASAVGYRDPSYFSRLFRDTFGCSPTEYAERGAAAADVSDNAP